jgi:hypothetical protein
MTRNVDIRPDRRKKAAHAMLDDDEDTEEPIWIEEPHRENTVDETLFVEYNEEPDKKLETLKQQT